VNLIPAFGLLSAVLWLGDRFTAARAVAISLIGRSVAMFATVEFVAATLSVSGPARDQSGLDELGLDELGLDQLGPPPP
jgi:hypothetical protein